MCQFVTGCLREFPLPVALLWLAAISWRFASNGVSLFARCNKRLSLLCCKLSAQSISHGGSALTHCINNTASANQLLYVNVAWIFAVAHAQVPCRS
jgi:hypothetical protein